MVAYADNEDDAVHLCLMMASQTSGIYISVQPRPLFLFDAAPNQWKSAFSRPGRNCACDKDIEYITALFFDVDVMSKRRRQHPASDEELHRSHDAVQLLIQEKGFSSHATICCSGNGHHVLVPIVPVLLDTSDVSSQFKLFCEQSVESAVGKVNGAKFDPVFNVSRVMRVMGTVNRKGQTGPDRPHRRAHFVTEPIFARSMALHHMIVNTELEHPSSPRKPLSGAIRCDPGKLEDCEFVQWCRHHPRQVSEPHWFALITNLAHLDGGIALIHEISRLDKARYEHANTQRVIERVLRIGYQPQCCRSFTDNVGAQPGKSTFQCSRIVTCPARAPMYIAT